MKLYTFLCLFLGVSLTTYKQVDAYNECPNGWDRYSGSCYHIRYSVEGVNWYAALKYCEGLGATLPVVASPVDNIELQTRIVNLRHELQLQVDDPVFTWLGYQNNGEGWKWLETGKLSTYEYFKNVVLDPEPGTSNCAAMYLNGIDTGYWSDFNCDFSLLLKYVTCERIVEPTVRLVDGPTDLEGRVEVKVNGRWGTICDDYWTNENSDVVCRQLGYPMSVMFRPGTADRAGSGNIWLDDVKCTGNERFVTSCEQAEIGTTNCKHNEDVWIKCSNGTERSREIPKWFTATKDCYDWDSVCDGNCYSTCGDQSLVQEVDQSSKRLRVITTHVDLNSLDKYIPENYGDVTTMEIFSQNVVLNNNFMPAYHLQIFARRLQMRDTALLNYDSNSQCYRVPVMDHGGVLYNVFNIRREQFSVIIFAESIDFPGIKCLVLSRSSHPLNFPIIPEEYLSLSATCVGVQTLSLGLMSNNYYCEKYVILDTINSIINMGPSREVMEWVINIKNKVQSKETGVRFVPSLSHHSYETMLETYQNDLEVLSNGLIRFQDKDTNFEEKLEILDLFKANAEDVLEARELEYINGQNEIKISRKTIELLQDEFDELIPKLEEVRDKFESDVKKYTVRQSFKAFFTLVEGIATIFAAGSGESPDVGAILKGMTDINQNLLDLQTLLVGIVGLFGTIDDIGSYLDGTSNPSEGELTDYVTSMRKLADLKLSVLAWQSLENTADGLLSQGTVTKIPSAGEYRQVVSDVADYGRAITEEIIRHTQLVLQGIEDKQWLSVSRNEVERLEGVIDETTERQLNHGLIFSELEFQTYFLIYTIKETVDTFCKSKFYYQFSECDPASLPVMSDSIRLVRQKIGSLLRSHIQGLTQFVYGRTQPIFITKKIQDENDCARRGKYANIADCPIQSLKRSNNVYVSIGLNSTEFLDLYRVRVEKIRVYLKGDIGEDDPFRRKRDIHREKRAKKKGKGGKGGEEKGERGHEGGSGEKGGKSKGKGGGKKKSNGHGDTEHDHDDFGGIFEEGDFDFYEEEELSKVKLSVQTTGVFYDRHGARDYEFTGVQVNKKFEYRIGEEDDPILDGDIYSDVADSYVNTTPFTTWNIRVPEKQNRDLNLRNLNAIVVEFYGTAVVGY